MGKTKLRTMGNNNVTSSYNGVRRLTIANWDKIAEGVDRANTMEGESFYSIRIGSLGAVIVHREIDADHCVIVEVSNTPKPRRAVGQVYERTNRKGMDIGGDNPKHQHCGH